MRINDNDAFLLTLFTKIELERRACIMCWYRSRYFLRTMQMSKRDIVSRRRKSLRGNPTPRDCISLIATDCG